MYRVDNARTTRLKKLLASIDRVMLAVAFLAVFTLLIEWGWGATLSPLAMKAVLALTALVVTFFLFETFAKLLLDLRPLAYLKANLFEFLLTAAFIILLFSAGRLYEIAPLNSFLDRYSVSLRGFYLLLGQVYLLASVLMKIINLQKQLSATGIKPAAVVVGSFAFVIVIGTILLSSPHAVAEDALLAEGRPSLVDSFFTATSAVCVTGLIVKNTGAYFSTFGQVVILCLIQIGGLGLMTFVAFSSLMVGKAIALREQVVMQDVLSYDVMARLPRLIIYILFVTFTCELIGAVALYPVWHGTMNPWSRAYLSIFHSISSFCNAGFSLFPDSFVSYRASFTLNAVVTSLIIFGGLGFIVQQNLIDKFLRALRARFLPRSLVFKRPGNDQAPAFLSLQTRIVLVTTAVLLLCGVLLFASLEWNNSLDGLSLKEKLFCTWFQSVTPRTAGFNTVSFSSLKDSTYLSTVILMFIGASPGGTGGGIKTSTFALLLVTVFSALKNRRNVETMRRTVPYRTVRQAVMVVLLAFSLVVAGLFVLTVSEEGVPFQRLLFEQVSAFGTVGLSPGAPGTSLSLSASLSWLGKLVIIVTMFAGRIGPLTLIIAVAQRRSAGDYEYPGEQVLIG